MYQGTLAVIADSLDPLSVLDESWTRERGGLQQEPWPGVAEMRRLAQRGQRRIVMLEMAVGGRLPDYRGRRDLRARLTDIELIDDLDVVIFADAAHSGFYWSWNGHSAAGGRRHVDYRYPTRTASIKREIRSLPAALPMERSTWESSADPLQACIVRRIARYVGQSGCDAGDLGALLRAIEDTQDIRPLRRVWNGLGRLAILDESCGAGDWLLSTGHMLESIYLACIDRMRAWVDDPELTGRRRRPEYLSDFRSTVGGAEESRLYASPEAFIRRLLLQKNLFGISSATGDLELSRTLLDYGGFGDAGIPALDLNILRPVASTVWDGPAPDRSGDHRARETSSDFEELDVLAQALSLLRSYRLSGDGRQEAFRKAAAELTRRRRHLCRRLSRLGSPGDRKSSRATFLRRIDLGGFDVVRSSNHDAN